MEKYLNMKFLCIFLLILFVCLFSIMAFFGAFSLLFQIGYIVGIASYIGVFIYYIGFYTKKNKLTLKKVIIYLFFALSLICARPLIAPYVSFLKSEANSGTMLFYLYFFFLLFLRIPIRINALFALISLCMIPMSMLQNHFYTAEVFGILSFSQLITVALQEIIELRYNL